MDPNIIREISLAFSATGFQAAAKDISAVAIALEKAKSTNIALRNSIPAMEAAIRSYTKAYIDSQMAMEKSSDATGKALKTMAAGFGKLDSAAKAFLNTAIGFSTFKGLYESMQAGSKVLKGYNENLLALSASTSRSGIGLSELEKKVGQLGNSLSMTRMETIKLFDSYNKGFAMNSAKGFENMMRNIKDAVGPNVQAVQEMSDSLAGLAEKFPDLQVAIEKANIGDTSRLKIAAQQLMMTQQISVAEYKRIRQYTDGAKQMGAADTLASQSARRAQQETLETFQQFDKHKETIMLGLGKALMPLMRELGNWLREYRPAIQTFFENFASGIKNVVTHANELKKILMVVAGVWAGGRVLAMGHGIASVGGDMMTLLGGRNAGAGGGMIGGLFNGSRTGGLKAGLGGAGLMAAGSGLGYAGGAVADMGYERTGAGIGVAGNLASVAGGALTGAAIGTAILPGIGTGVGALVGLTGSLVANWSSIKDNFSTLLGYESEQAKHAREQKTQQETSAKNVKDFYATQNTSKSASEKIQEQVDKTVKDVSDKAFSNPSVYESVFANQASTKKKYEEEQERQKQRLAGQSVGSFAGQTFHATLSDNQAIEDKKAEIQKRMNQAENEGGSDANAKIAAGQKYLDELTKMQDKIKDLTEADREQNSALIEAEGAYKANAAAVETLNAAYNGQQKILQKLTEYTQANEAAFQSMIQTAQVSGDVDFSKLEAGFEQVAAAKEAEIQQAQRLLDLRQKMNTVDGLSGEELEQGNEASRKAFGVDLAGLEVAKLQLNLETKQREAKVSTARAADQITDAMKTQLEVAAAEASLAATRVQLMDNYATGVGASAKMREMQVGFIGKEIGLLKQQYAEQQRVYDRTGSEESLAKMLNYENQIYQKKLQQAQISKVLKDGWISALGAMNTASGRFTKIMISQEQNLSAGLGRFGTVVSNTSGALKNAGGTYKDDVGFGQSTKFSAFSPGELTRQDRLLPFSTGRGEDNTALISRQLRNGSAMDLGDEIESRVERAVANGAMAGQAAMEQAQGGGTAGMSGNTSGSSSSKNIRRPGRSFRPQGQAQSGRSGHGGFFFPQGTVPDGTPVNQEPDSVGKEVATAEVINRKKAFEDQQQAEINNASQRQRELKDAQSDYDKKYREYSRATKNLNEVKDEGKKDRGGWDIGWVDSLTGYGDTVRDKESTQRVKEKEYREAQSRLTRAKNADSEANRQKEAKDAILGNVKDTVLGVGSFLVNHDSLGILNAMKAMPRNANVRQAKSTSSQSNADGSDGSNLRDTRSSGVQTVAAVGSASGRQMLNVVIPSVAVQVRFDNMNQLQGLIGQAIVQEMNKRGVVSSSLGDTASRNRTANST